MIDTDKVYVLNVGRKRLPCYIVESKLVSGTPMLQVQSIDDPAIFIWTSLDKLHHTNGNPIWALDY